MNTRYAEVKQALDRLGYERCLYLWNDNLDDTITKSLVVKRHVLYEMHWLCWSLRDYALFYENSDVDANMARCVNAIFDKKDTPFSIEHPVMAEYFRKNYKRKIARVTVDVFTRRYPAPLSEGQPITFDDWVGGYTKVRINGQSVFRNHIIVRNAYFIAVQAFNRALYSRDMKMMPVKGSPTGVRYTKRGEFMALVLTGSKGSLARRI